MKSEKADLAKKMNVRKPKPEEMEIESVRIEPAGNGFTVSTSRRLKKEARERGDCCMSWPEPERNVFTDPEAMSAHVRSIFGGEAKAE